VARTAVKLRFSPSKPISTCATAGAMAPPAPSSPGKASMTVPRPAGRGWAVLGGAGRLGGHIFIHKGDDLRFVAQHECLLQQPALRFAFAKGSWCAANREWRSSSPAFRSCAAAHRAAPARSLAPAAPTPRPKVARITLAPLAGKSGPAPPSTSLFAI